MIPPDGNMSLTDLAGAAVLGFCLRMYTGSSGGSESPFGGRHILGDFNDDELRYFPPTLIICGTDDPLIHGNRIMAARLSAAGRDVKMFELPGNHAFLGFPVQWTGEGWLKNTWPAYERMVQFISGPGADLNIPPGWPRPVDFDWTVVVVAVSSSSAASLLFFVRPPPRRVKVACVRTLGGIASSTVTQQ